MSTRRGVLTGGAAMLAAMGVGGCPAAPADQAAAPVADAEADALFLENLEEPEEGSTIVRSFSDWQPYWHNLPAAEREAPVVPSDADSVDYAQFPAGTSSASATVNGAAMRKAFAWSSIDPAALGQRILFGLRGAELLNAPDFANARMAGAIELRDARPDHLTPKCIIGVWNTADDTFWAAQSSTVPHMTYLFAQRKAAAAARANGTAIDKFCNMLGCGVYNYYVGTHHNRKPGRQPGAFRLVDSVAVVRNLDDGPVSITRRDTWEFRNADISDNIHAGAATDVVNFWSAGCQVVPGSYSADRRTPNGEWRNFRVAAGLKADPVISAPDTGQPNCWETDEDGVRMCPTYTATGQGRYSYVLMTGTEARLAAQNPAAADNDQQFARLRRGSSGPRARALTQALGMTPMNRINAAAQRAIIERQIAAGAGADGIITPAEATRLGLAMTW